MSGPSLRVRTLLLSYGLHANVYGDKASRDLLSIASAQRGSPVASLDDLTDDDIRRVADYIVSRDLADVPPRGTAS